MSAIKQGSLKHVVAATAAAALFGLIAMPAQAILEWEVTVGAAHTVVLVVADGGVNDINPLPNAITVNIVALNAALLAAGSEYVFVSAGASSNFPGISGPIQLAAINTSALINNTGSGGQLDIEATQDGWLIPTANPRTLTNAPAATLTLLTAPGDNMDSTAFNNPNNGLFNTTGAFFTPTSLFTPGNQVGAVGCTANVGGVSSCNDLTTRPGMVEGNPYSITQIMNFNLTNSGIPKTIQFTDASTKFANIPEPASLLLLGTGLAALGFGRRRKNP